MDKLPWLLLILPAGLFLAAFWSGSETALTSLSAARIKKIVAHHQKIAKTLSQWLNNPEYFLITILVGNTLTNLSLSHLTTLLILGILPRSWHSPAGIFLWLFLTGLVLIFGEISPKLLARRYSERITIAILPVYDLIMRILRPIIWVIRKISGSSQTFVLPTYKLNIGEIKQLLSESRLGGMVPQETEQMVLQALRLNRVTTKEIMTPAEQVEAVDLNLERELLLDKLVATGRSRIPVYRTNPRYIVGYIHMRDLLWLGNQSSPVRLLDIVKPPYFVSPEMKLLPLLNEFRSGHTHIAFVVNEAGELLGLVTLEDILEEILGEILDEYDVKKGKKCLS